MFGPLAHFTRAALAPLTPASHAMTHHLELLHRPAEGPRARHPVLFLHGAFAGAWCWEPNFMPYFSARGHDCYALSLRGHAGSQGRERLNQFGIGDYVSSASAITSTTSRRLWPRSARRR